MTGQINVSIYYGSPYDWNNIPYNPNQIAQHSTRIKVVSGAYVWQTTWLDVITVNVENYNDIVGAQWVKIEEVDPEQYHGAHWYYVLDYSQDSNKSVTLSLQYDPLLSIGVNAISKISGTIQRWTVDDDSDPFKFVVTAEPIDQADPFKYSYQTVDPTSGPNMSAVMGSPVSLEDSPEILNYVNPSGEDANIFYPKMKPIESPTQFITSYPQNRVANDGLLYYFWAGESTAPVKQNYSLAVGLGYDLTTVAYSLPQSDLIVYAANGLRLTSITGNRGNFLTSSMAGHGLTVSGYNNAKTSALGLWFTLFNTTSGDNITVANYELSTLGVSVWPDVTREGRFYARFNGYYGNSGGTSGAVRSAPWLPVTLTSGVGAGSIAAQIETNLGYQELQTQQEVQSRNIAADIATGSLTGLTAIAGGILAAQPLAIAGGALSLVNTMIRGATASDNLRATMAQQRNALRVRGTISTNTPPGVKYGGVSGYTSDNFKFLVRATSLSDNDRQRADQFFTAYGYNVDRYPLTSPAQLSCRQRFTYIMADDVHIEAGTSLERIEDSKTVTAIQERFTNGIRIWKVKPDYDWTIYNGVI